MKNESFAKNILIKDVAMRTMSLYRKNDVKKFFNA